MNTVGTVGGSGSFLAAGVGSAARGRLAGYRAPITVDRAEGSRIVDVDGRSYIDYVLALGPLIHGHRPAPLREAVDGALDRYGSMVGLGHALEHRAAELVVESVPSADLVRFSNSGTEAVMMAIRIARAVTGRRLIVRFEGHFHGWSDVIHWSVKPPLAEAGPADAPLPVKAMAGIPDALGETIAVLPWNDQTAVDALFRARGAEIAAVITEPLMANCGCIEPQPGFLAHLRDVTSASGALLIFDEVVTGFRLGLGGAQAHFGVSPDLTTLAKALGGGYPVAAVAGTSSALGLVASERLPYLGTYNTNPVCMAAVVATIEALRPNGVYDRLQAIGARLADGLVAEFHAAGLPATWRGHGSVFQIWFTERPAATYRDAVEQARPDFYRRFHEAMLERGVLIHPSQFEHLFVSTAHREADIDQTLAAARDAIREIAPSFGLS